MKEKLMTKSRDYLMIILGLSIYAFGFTAFILPEKIVIGGMAGIGSLIYYVTGIPVGALVFAINAILLAIAYKSVSKTFVIRTVFGTGVMSVLILLMQPLFNGPIVHDQPFMNVIIGAMLCGFGIGLVFVYNGSTGGTDIIAAVINRYRNISIGRAMIYCDIVIISSAYLLPENEGFDKLVYGFFATFVIANICDFIINASRRSVQFMIFTKHHEKLANALNQDAKRGVTVVDGQGWYSKQPIKILIVLSKQSESVNIFRVIKEVDPDAFISQANVTGVFGQGFDRMR